MKKPTLRTWRRTIQIGVAAAFIIIPWLNHLRISVIYGNFLSFHFYKFPLADPLAVLQVTLKNWYFSTELMIGAGIALVPAVLLGTVFCSWACPFGLFSEIGHGWAKRFRMKTDPATGSGFKLKLILFGVGLFGFFFFSTTPALNQLSLPAWYSRIFQFWFEQQHISPAGGVLIAFIGVEMIAGKRLWCRYICPQSVLISLAKQLSRRRLQIGYDQGACSCKNKTGAVCVQACSLGLDPKDLNRRFETECTNCGDCTIVCKNRGSALVFRTFPIEKTSWKR